MSDETHTPKIHIDSDWKMEAEQEKERLAEEEAARQQDPRGPLGKPTVMHLVNMLAMQATVALGGARGPQGEMIPPDPEMARFHIDLLSVIEEKTKGNLSKEEETTIGAVLHELRTMYIHLAQAAAAPPPPQGS